VSRLLLGIGALAGVYQAVSLAASLRQLFRREAPARALPPVSILKPIHGFDPDFAACIGSHALLDYPDFEILFGVADPADPAVPEVERLMAAHPAVPIRLIHSRTRAANGKAGVLADLAVEARYPVLVVNDSDIEVPRDYLRRIVAPLEDPRIGMVTCLYRARARSWPGRLEALGIATDFAPSVLVAPLVGVSEFALGSTMAFRAADLRRAGGFESIGDFLADDYQLSRRIRGLGLEIAISRCVVETHLDAASWGDAWRHQVRWARTVRMSRSDGYVGLPVTHAALWSALLLAAGHRRAAAALMGLRMAAAAAGALALGEGRAARDLPLVPLRDLAGVAVWAAGLFGSEVTWRDVRLRLDRDGRIVEGVSLTREQAG
jgi:ceramide glucosyltransferase